MSYFINAITKHYVDFRGRARRKEYWMFHLFAGLMMWGLLFLFLLLMGVGVANSIQNDPEGFQAAVESGAFFNGVIAIGAVVYLLFLVALLGLMLPSLAVSVRRLHDVGKSGAFYLLNFIPLIGQIWFLVLMCTDGQPGFNQYGPNPKLAGASAMPQAGFCAACGAPQVQGAAFCARCGRPA